MPQHFSNVSNGAQSQSLERLLHEADNFVEQPKKTLSNLLREMPLIGSSPKQNELSSSALKSEEEQKYASPLKQISPIPIHEDAKSEHRLSEYSKVLTPHFKDKQSMDFAVSGSGNDFNAMENFIIEVNNSQKSHRNKLPQPLIEEEEKIEPCEKMKSSPNVSRVVDILF